MPKKSDGAARRPSRKKTDGRRASLKTEPRDRNRPVGWGSGALPADYANLSPTAIRLLEAARVLLERSGYEGLRLEAISEESGLAHSLIRYHFGGKDGLVGALIDWCLYETYTEMHQDFSSLAVDDIEGGIHALSAGLRRLFDSPLSYRLYLDLAVACQHDDNMRAKMADSFEGQRALIMESIREPAGRVSKVKARELASIACAFADGLAIQYLSDPSSVDLDRVFSLWDEMLEGILRREVPNDGEDGHNGKTKGALQEKAG